MFEKKCFFTFLTFFIVLFSSVKNESLVLQIANKLITI